MENIRTFLMLGRPGSGKGTQGKLLADKIGATVYSSGSYLRPLSQENTFVGRKVKEVMERGDLLPDWFSIHVFERALLGLEPADGIVFEGACRRLTEAHAFKETVDWLGRPYKAIFLDVPEEALKKRLIERRAAEGRADDATLTVIENRFKVYKENTEPAIEFLRKEGVLETISGDHSIEETHQLVFKALGLS